MYNFQIKCILQHDFGGMSKRLCCKHDPVEFLRFIECKDYLQNMEVIKFGTRFFCTKYSNNSTADYRVC